jgi:hypothetical protein
MFGLGKADCIFVSKWSRGDVCGVLIDGGEKQHAPYIKAFLRRRRALDSHGVSPDYCTMAGQRRPCDLRRLRCLELADSISQVMTRGDRG